MLRECDPRVIGTILKELIVGRFSGFYFIEYTIDEDSNGRVVLLREVRQIPRVIAERIREGLEVRALKDDGFLHAATSNVLDLTETEMLLPIAQTGYP